MSIPAFALATRLADPVAYFAIRSGDDLPLAARARWLDSHRERHVLATPEGAPHVSAAAAALRDWGVSLSDHDPSDPIAVLVAIGLATAADLVLLACEPGQRCRVVAGVVCFPSRWRLGDKLGRSLQDAHAPVPGLNDAMGGTIDRLVERLAVERPVTRWNWSVTGDPELNQHPDRPPLEMTPPISPDAIWLRREEQLLARLPDGATLAFGIRVTHTPWPAVIADRGLAKRIATELETMPEELARYKRFEHARRELVESLKGGSS